MSDDHPLIQFRNSPIHGMGGFARSAIQPGTLIIEYVGERIDKTESSRRCQQNNEYIFCIDDTFDLDGNVPWNPARLINHSCAPNCEAEWLDNHIWLVARRAIAPGEELTFNYGYDLQDLEDHPCHCGSPQCVGWMVAEEFFPEVAKRRATAGTQSSSSASSFDQE
jgi:SET domain-containing protein